MTGVHGPPTLGLEAAQAKQILSASGPLAQGTGLLLAQWLEAISGGEAAGLSQAYASGCGDFGACLIKHFPSAQNFLTHRFGKNFLPEILSFAEETDPELFAQAWLGFARRQQGAGRLEAAASIYESISRSELSLRGQAQREFDALQGRGAIGARVEFLLGQFAEQASDPGMLGGMMLASLAFQGVRLAGLSRLLAAPEATWLTRGLGARAAAAGLGFAAEVPTFLLASKGIHQAMGRNQDWSVRALGQEGLSLGISLLFLKGFGALARGGIRSLHGEIQSAPGAFTRFSTATLPQAASLAGIYLGHQAEVGLGLRPKLDDATALTDSLVFLLQFHVGGKLSGALLGPGYAANLRRLELLSETMAPVPRPLDGGFPGLGLGPRPLAVGAGFGTPAEFAAKPLPPAKWADDTLRPLQMSQLGAGESSSYRFLEQRLLRHIMETMEPGPEAEAAVRDRFPRTVEEIADNYLKTPNVDMQRYFGVLQNSRLKDVAHEDGRVTTRIEQLSVAVKYFRYAMEMNPLRRAVGSLYDHMMQESLERTLKDGSTADFEALVKVAGLHRRIESAVEFLEQRGWHQRYVFLPQPPPEPVEAPSLRARLQSLLKLDSLLNWFRRPAAAPVVPEWLPRLRSLALSAEAKQAVERYLVSYSQADSSAPFRDPENNYILWKPKPREERREVFTAEVGVEGLANYLQAWKGKPVHMRVLDDAIRRAAASSVPLLYFDRIFKVLATHDLPHKIAEVASSEEFHWGKLEGFLELSRPEPGYESTAKKLNGTIYTGYIYDQPLAEKFARFYQNAGLFMGEYEGKIRLGRFHHTAKHLLSDMENYGRANGKEDVLQMLRLSASPDAKRAVEALERGRADIEVVSREKLRELWEALPPNRRGGNNPKVVFREAGRDGAHRATVMVAKKVGFDEVDILYMLKLHPTPVANLAIQAIEKGEVELQVLPKQELTDFWRKMDPSSKDEEPPKAFYLPARKSPNGRPLIVVSELDPHLTWEQKIWESIWLPAQTVHEFEHHLHRDLDNLFLSEMRAWLEETYFLMYNGDLRGWNEMQETSPYGFGVYLRNLVDKTYVEGPHHVSRKK